MLSRQSLLVALCALAGSAFAQNNSAGAFDNPPASGVAGDFSGISVYPVGTQITVTWDTVWDQFSLVLYQNNNGTFQYLPHSQDISVTSFPWTATVDGLFDLRHNNVFFFAIFLEGSGSQWFGSQYFNISNDQVDAHGNVITSSTSASSSTSSTSSTKASSATASATSSGGSSQASSAATAAWTGTSAPAATAAPSSGGLDTDAKVGLGVGLGIGLLGVIALIVAITLFYRKRHTPAPNAGAADPSYSGLPQHPGSPQYSGYPQQGYEKPPGPGVGNYPAANYPPAEMPATQAVSELPGNHA